MSLVSTNGWATGWIGTRTNPVPHSLSEYGVPIIWTMTASGTYFDTVTDNLVWPAHMSFGGGKAGEPEPDHRHPCIMVRRDGKPGLPMLLVFRTGDGRTNASYRATGFREFGKLSLPSGFVWERYGGLDYGEGYVKNRVDERIVARITNFVATCNRRDLRPRVVPGMNVTDYRVRQPTNPPALTADPTPPGNATNPPAIPGRKGYVTRDTKWPSVATAQDLVDGRKRTAKTWIGAAMGAVALLGGAVWWLRRRWRRPFTPVQPPTDLPNP